MDKVKHALAQRRYMRKHPEVRAKQYKLSRLWKIATDYNRVWVGKHPGFRSYTNMLARCYDKSHKSYKYYGQRGIKVCDAWKHSFKQFYKDMGPRPCGLTLDRIDGSGDYMPENCCWSSMKEQNAPLRRHYR